MDSGSRRLETIDMSEMLLRYENGVRNFTGLQIADCSANECSLEGATFERCYFTQVHLSKINFKGSLFLDSRFERSNLTNCNYYECSFRKCTFEACSCEGCDWYSSYFEDCTLGTLLKTCRFGISAHKNTTITGSAFDCDFTLAKLETCRLFRVHLVRCKFVRAELHGCDLLFATMESTNEFVDARLLGTKIHRGTLDCLTPGLTPAQLSSMQIQDDLALLRASYTGFMNVLHLVALAAFLLPYAVYLWKISLRASARCDAGQCEFVISRFWHFIYSGGNMDHQIACWSVLAFAFALLYNGIRAVLLWKANKLELQRQATGFSPRFALDGWWGRLYWWSTSMFWVNIAALIVHSVHFMTRYLPA